MELNLAHQPTFLEQYLKARIPRGGIIFIDEVQMTYGSLT